MLVRGLTGAVLGLALLVPAAGAATPTIGEAGDTATFTGTADPDGVAIELTHLPLDVWTVSPTPPSGAVLALPSCAQDPGGMSATCPVVPRLDVNGNGGDDNLVFAFLDETTARLTLHGGTGDDVLGVGYVGLSPLPGSGPGDVFGDAGTDTLSLKDGNSDVVTVSLDDAANDGVRQAPDVNVHSDVENVVGEAADDQLTGSAEPNRLDGGASADTIRGGGGSDTLIGGFGDDHIDAADGKRDTVHCGQDNDTVDADAIDALDECERVRIAPAPPTTGGSDGTTPPPPTTKKKKPRRILSPIGYVWTGSHVDSMVVRRVPRHGRVRLSCNKRGCPFRHAEGKVRHRRAKLTPLFRDTPIPVGATLEVRITAPQRIGEVVRWKIRSTVQVPRHVILCLPPGKTKPRHC